MLSIIYSECHICCHIQALYDECHYAECYYAECRGTVVVETPSAFALLLYF
jgi:hypothetical protein